MTQTKNFGTKGGKPCCYCGKWNNWGRMYCVSHGLAIRKWISTEGQRAGEIWLDRNLYNVAYINHKIEKYS